MNHTLRLGPRDVVEQAELVAIAFNVRARLDPGLLPSIVLASCAHPVIPTTSQYRHHSLSDEPSGMNMNTKQSNKQLRTITQSASRAARGPRGDTWGAATTNANTNTYEHMHEI